MFCCLFVDAVKEELIVSVPVTVEMFDAVQCAHCRVNVTSSRYVMNVRHRYVALLVAVVPLVLCRLLQAAKNSDCGHTH